MFTYNLRLQIKWNVFDWFKNSHVTLNSLSLSFNLPKCWYFLNWARPRCYAPNQSLTRIIFWKLDSNFFSDLSCQTCLTNCWTLFQKFWRENKFLAPTLFLNSTSWNILLIKVSAIWRSGRPNVSQLRY